MTGFKERASRACVSALAVLALTAAPSGAAPTLPPIKHVFVIVLENKGFDETFGFYSPTYYLSLTLPSLGALLPNYFGVTHQSLGNYLAMVSGQGSNPLTQADCPLFTDVVPGAIGARGQASGLGCVYQSSVKTIADQLASARLSWRGYMEDMGNKGTPNRCQHPAFGSLDTTQTARAGNQYATRHNPFVYFHSLLDSGACGRGDVPLTQLPGDLTSAASTPSYSFITPNLCNDGHDCGYAGINPFLSTWVPRILRSPAYRTGGLLAIVFDEADGTDATACCGEPSFPNTPTNGGLTPGPGGGRTGAVLLSPFIDPGTVDEAGYNHFSLLRSIENLFGLGHLGFAAQPGLQAFGQDLFTCYPGPAPRPRRGRLPGGSEIKLAQIGQGTATRPSVEIKLWHAGRVQLQVARVGARRLRAVGRGSSGGPCQLLKIRLPYLHGRALISARALGGVERRTLYF